MNAAHFGRYVINSELGRGGMATVYHAYDPRFERDVAIKVLPHAFLHDPQFRVRFDREAKMVALLEHPAIVPVYDFGEEAEQPYIVMRYMSGGSLADRLAQGAISPLEAAQIIARLAPALDAAHARGIIHRDLKPGNILFDQYGNAFLSDFGIARMVSPTAATLTGEAIVGTPAYMSPEQVQGEKTLDGRSDIYAMGVILFQMITGQTPYRSETPAKIMMMHLLDPVPQVSTAVFKEIPRTINTVLSKALAKDPTGRFATTSEMATALESAARGQVPPEVHPSAATRIARPHEQPQARPAAGATSVSAHPGVGTPPPFTPPPQTRPAERGIPLWGWGIGVVGIFGLLGVLALAAIFLSSGGFSLFAAATATPTLEVAVVQASIEAPTQEIAAAPGVTGTAAPTEPPTNTPEPTPTPTLQPTPTLEPTPTETPPPTPTSPPPVIVKGGADKIAFLSGNNVYIANLDGSSLEALTADLSIKTDLQWFPDGKEVMYISGKCVYAVEIDTKRINTVLCLDAVQYFSSFSVSPDSTQAALIIDFELYIIRFDRAALQQAHKRPDLSPLAVCQYWVGYDKIVMSYVRWSDDMTKLSVIYKAIYDGHTADEVRLMDASACRESFYQLDNFPATRFQMSGYRENPVIQNFTWDGDILYSLVNNRRNDGYGDLFVYDSSLYRLLTSQPGFLYINPVHSGTCCYRDPALSPDGTLLAVAFQDINDTSNKVEIYIIPLNTLGSGIQYAPLEFGQPLFPDRKEKPLITLRPAR